MATYFVWNEAMNAEDFVTSKEGKYEECIEFMKSYKLENKQNKRK